MQKVLSGTAALAWCLLLITAVERAWPQMDYSCLAIESTNQRNPSTLPVPPKMAGLGNAHISITASQEAQAWFDQGLNLLHDYWDYEAAKAFEQSIRTDARCAMCYWGLYQAESSNHSTMPSYSKIALDEAIALKSNANKQERLYIDASAAHSRVSRSADEESSSSREVESLRELVKRYPDDIEASVFLAKSVPKSEAAQILLDLLRRSPNSSVANHEFIHVVEGTTHPEQALHSAEILPKLAPASAHMVHMPGHIFFALATILERSRHLQMHCRLTSCTCGSSMLVPMTIGTMYII